MKRIFLFLMIAALPVMASAQECTLNYISLRKMSQDGAIFALSDDSYWRLNVEDKFSAQTRDRTRNWMAGDEMQLCDNSRLINLSRKKTDEPVNVVPAPAPEKYIP